MNIPPGFIRTADYVRFKRGINHPDALEFLLNLLERCQINKACHLNLEDDLDLSLMMGLPDSIPAANVRELLIESRFAIKDYQNQPYRILLFEAQNAQLIAAWKNGMRGGRPSNTHGL